MVQINDQLAFYKSWTTSLDPYLPEIYWDQLSTSAQKNAFLEMLPTVYTAGKESLQIAKITVESVQIRELESFFLFLNKNRDKDIDNEKLEQAKIAIKDFLAFIQSNKQ